MKPSLLVCIYKMDIDWRRIKIEKEEQDGDEDFLSHLLDDRN